MTGYPKYYFAYGSNLDAERFGRRIGRDIRPQDMRRGVLKGYGLSLSKPGACEKCKKVGVAKANIVKNDSQVEGIIYTIKNANEHEKLRACEGYHSTPKQYNEYDKTINTATDATKCFVYIAPNDAVKPSLPAEKHYLDYIRNGKPFLSEQYCSKIETLFAETELHQCDGV